EPWHFDYFPAEDRHRNEGIPATVPGKTPTTPVEELDETEDEEMKGAYFQNSDGLTVYMLFNEASGFCVEHSGTGADYNNPIARNWDTGSWVKITESHARVLRNALAAVRNPNFTGSLSVDIKEES